jgi:hypothetical protein
MRQVITYQSAASFIVKRLRFGFLGIALFLAILLDGVQIPLAPENVFYLGKPQINTLGLTQRVLEIPASIPKACFQSTDVSDFESALCVRLWLYEALCIGVLLAPFVLAGGLLLLIRLLLDWFYGSLRAAFGVQKPFGVGIFLERLKPDGLAWTFLGLAQARVKIPTSHAEADTVWIPWDFPQLKQAQGGAPNEVLLYKILGFRLPLALFQSQNAALFGSALSQPLLLDSHKSSHKSTEAKESKQDAGKPQGPASSEAQKSADKTQPKGGLAAIEKKGSKVPPAAESSKMKADQQTSSLKRKQK